MRIAYFDCFCGAAGDMIVAALLDAGLEWERLRLELAGLELGSFEVSAAKVTRQGFAATSFRVNVTVPDPPHRHLKDIKQFIADSRLTPRVKEQATSVFVRLADAEAAVHGTSPESVHFHEVGAVDAIVDVVAACSALQLLAVDKVVCSPIPPGSGAVTCEHGVLPVPAPATAQLLKGVPLASCDEEGELTTPTGAAILTTLAAAYGPVPAMTLERVGCGSGTREGRRRPNLLRVLIGQAEGVGEVDEIVVLETNLDDLSGEVTGYAVGRLLDAGALDVFCVPIYMKKNRPAVLLTVLAAPQDADRLEAVLFAETASFGVRRSLARRNKLRRETLTVQTRYGPIRMKVGRRGQNQVTASPEYEDCRLAAESHAVPLREVMGEAWRCWQASHPAGSPPP